MIDNIAISCSLSGAMLRLHSPLPRDERRPVESFATELKHGKLRAETRIDTYMANFVELFAELANEWRGWEGEKVGGSADMDLVFQCTADGYGHVFVQTTLRSGPMDEDWAVETTLRLDAQPLKEFAKKLRQFLRHDSQAA